MVTVSTSVCAAVLLIVTDGDARLHVAGLVAPDGPLTAQVRPTAPVNPPEGVTVIVDVLPVVAPATMGRVAGLDASVMPGTAAAEPATTNSRPRVCTYFPVESTPVSSTL